MTMSSKERQMFEMLGHDCGYYDQGYLKISDMYFLAVKKVFLNKCYGPAVESLRRTFGAFQDNYPYRGTSEFDALIDLDNMADYD